MQRRALRDSLSVRAPFRRPNAVQLRAAYKGSVARSPSARTRAKQHRVTALRGLRSPEQSHSPWLARSSSPLTCTWPS